MIPDFAPLDYVAQFLDVLSDAVYGENRMEGTEEDAVNHLKATILSSSGREATEDFLNGVLWMNAVTQQLFEANRQMKEEQVAMMANAASAAAEPTEERSTVTFGGSEDEDDTPVLKLV